MEQNHFSTNTEFDTFIRGEARRVQGVYTPVKAAWPERLLKRKASCRKLHPNPDDDFCKPEIGPSYDVISQYVHRFRENWKHSHRYCEEELIVEKTRPDGYRIINGHHRWAAALRMGKKTIPVKIVNLTLEEDMRKMLENARHDKRVTLDLDEVVFREKRDERTEKPLPFFLRRHFREPLRLGIPALFRFLSTRGYDIWVYTRNPYSMDHVRNYFRCYRVPVYGIVTGTGRKSASAERVKREMEQLTKQKYACTVHIDEHTVLRSMAETGEYQEFPLSGKAADWSYEIMQIMGAWN